MTDDTASTMLLGVLESTKQEPPKKSHENDHRLTSVMNDVNMIMCMNYDVSSLLRTGLPELLKGVKKYAKTTSGLLLLSVCTH